MRLLKLSCKFQDASCKKKQKAGVGGSGFVVGKSTLNQKSFPAKQALLSLMLLSVDGSLLLDGQRITALPSVQRYLDARSRAETSRDDP